MNKVFIMGRLGKSVDLKYTPTGVAVASFSVATSETFLKNGNKETKTEWHNVIVWGKFAEVCSRHLNKGSLVFIEGTIQTRSWEENSGAKRYKTEIIASEVKFLDLKSSSEPSPEPEKSEPSVDSTWAQDEIPF